MYLSPQAAFVRRHRHVVTLTVLAVTCLTCIALSAIAGWPATLARLRHLSGWFIPLMLVFHVASYLGYMVAHHHVVDRSRNIALGWARGAQVLLIGFGGFLIGGGFGVDRRALVQTGLSHTDASVAAMSLGALELLLLAPAVWICALLLLGTPGVPASFTLPWVIGLPIGAVLIAGAAVRGQRHGSAGANRLVRAASELVLGCRAAGALLRDPRRGPMVAAGLALYWAADIAALWAALRFVSTSLALPRLILAYSGAYILTRRTLPFAGVIVVETLMAVSLVSLGVTLAAAAIAVLVYRLSDFTLTLGGALLASSAVDRIVTFQARSAP